MKGLPLPVLVLSVFCSARAQEDSCLGSCGRRPLASSHGGMMRVIGGTNALPGTWPWMVSIQIPGHSGYHHSCGGSLISSRWVVTAAHCFINRRFLEHWKLVIGATQLSQPGPDAVERSIKNLVEHEQYNRRTNFNDIALMELNQPVNCSDYIQPACLPSINTEVASLSRCYVSGWGVTDMKKPTETADILQEAKVNLIPLATCNSSNWYNSRIHYNNICAGYEQGGIDSCQGDSGGPLMCREARSERFWVVGVTSWGTGCANAQKPGVYVSTQHFLDWIKGKTKEGFLSAGRPVLPAPAKPYPLPVIPKPVGGPSGQPWKPISQEHLQLVQNSLVSWPKPKPPTWQQPGASSGANWALFQTKPSARPPPAWPQKPLFQPPPQQLLPPPQNAYNWNQAWVTPRLPPLVQASYSEQQYPNWNTGQARPPPPPTFQPQWQPQKWTWAKPGKSYWRPVWTRPRYQPKQR